MSYKACEDCGTKLSNGICPNCQEELFIYETQYEDMDHPISDEFMRLVNEQAQQPTKGQR